MRKLFPALGRKVYGKNLVYFDNAATIQRPQSVLELWNGLAVNSNANIHRAVHRMADEATEAYEQARLCVKDFLNAESREEIVFTSGATASINLVAYSFGEKFVHEGDEVIVTEAEHHDLVERIESRHGLRQLSYMKELGMGNDRYILIDLDNGGRRITVEEAVKDLVPFVREQE